MEEKQIIDYINKDYFNSLTKNDFNTDNLVSLYIEEVNRYRLLTKDEEVELFKLYKNGNVKAREILIKHNLRLVISCALQYKYRSSHLKFLDLIEEGNIGLIKAVDSFDLSYECKFSTYAIKGIKMCIKSSLYNRGTLIRKSNSFRKVLSSKIEIEKKKGKEASIEEISNYSGISPNYVKEVLNKNYKIIPIDSAEAVNNISCCFEDDILEDTCSKHLYDIINESKLSLVQKEVIFHRFGFIDGSVWTYKKIANKLNISFQAASSAEKKALKKLRDNAKIKHFYDKDTIENEVLKK